VRTDQFEQHHTTRRRCGSLRGGDSIRIRLPAEPESVSAAREALVEIADEHGADREAVAVAVSEAVGNAIIHGYRAGSTGPISIDARVESDALLIAVTDRGVGMSPNPDRQGLGLGLPLIHQVASSVEIDQPPRGTRLRMRFALES
jgi:anti-sigma regulatory factor (Ser/Thr protein kinase)